MELLRKESWYIGGESSGHIICLDKHTTGDGIISALQVLHALCDSEVSLAELMQDVSLYPHRLINVKVLQPSGIVEHKEIQEVVKEAQIDLNAQGRVLLRASGTEPLIRVMVEGESEQKVDYWAEQIAEVVQKFTN